FVDPLTGRALIFVYELPILPPDSVYQLWAIRGQSPVDAGTFSVGADRRARLPIADAGIVLGADALAVTIEPAPGGPAPTGPIILSSTL
ncbi:MAG: anti-sigma factor, partial [Gemmatimonadota bacterium]